MLRTRALFVSALLLLACSSDPDETVAPGDGGDAAPPADGGVPDGSSPEPDGGADAGPKDRIGAVFAISDTGKVGGATKSSFRAGASFTHIKSAGSMTQTKTVGPCVIEIIGDGDAPVEEALSAGALRLSGGKKPVDLSPNAEREYEVVSGSEALWSGGETLEVAAEGKDVPAFKTSLTAPAPVTLTAPAVAAGALTVKRTDGVTATFTGTAGSVVLYFDVATGENAYTATCTFPANGGTGQVPAAAFADFPAGDGTFNFYVKETSSTSVAGWDVRFTASSAVVDSAGAVLVGNAKFE